MGWHKTPPVDNSQLDGLVNPNLKESLLANF